MRCIKLKSVFFGFFLFLIFVCQNVFASSTNSLGYFDLQLPMRCGQPNKKEQAISSVVALRSQDFTIRLPNQTSPLPRYQVNGYTFERQVVTFAVSNLMQEAEIKVIPEEGSYPVISANKLEGELSDILERLADKGEFFYTYNADKKELHIHHRTHIVVQLPENLQIMMAVMDALEGVKVEPIVPDWSKYQLDIVVTRKQFNKIRSILNTLINDQHLLSMQVSVYSLSPLAKDATWQKIITLFGATRIAMTKAGLTGRIFLLDTALGLESLLKTIEKKFLLNLIGSAQMVIPSDWTVRFNLKDCLLDQPYEDLSILFSSSILNKSKAQTKITLDSKELEVSSFEFNHEYNQEALISGITVSGSKNQELLLGLKFKFIDLIKKGDQRD